MGQRDLNRGFESLLFSHLNCVFLLNWIVQDWTVLTSKLLNWIIWNKTVFTFNPLYIPVGWGHTIHKLHLCRGGKTPPTSVLDMTLDNLMVRFQWFWSFGKCGALRHCHRSQVHSGPGVVAPDWALSMVQMELNFVLMLN